MISVGPVFAEMKKSVSLKKNNISNYIAMLNSNFFELKPYYLFNILKQVDEYYKKNHQNLSAKLEYAPKIFHQNLRLSHLIMEIDDISWSTGKEKPKKYYTLIKKKKEEIKLTDKMMKQRMSVAKKVDELLLQENSELIFSTPEYGLMVIHALKRSVKCNAIKWEDAKKFVPLLIEWKEENFGSLKFLRSNKVRLELFKILANFKEPELILLLGKGVETNNLNVGLLIDNLYGSIPHNTVDEVTNWYKQNRNKLIWQGADVFKFPETSIIIRSEKDVRTFYILSSEQ